MKRKWSRNSRPIKNHKHKEQKQDCNKKMYKVKINDEY